MNGAYPKIAKQVAVDDRDVAESNDPFWLFDKLREVQAVNDPDRTVSATGTKDGFQCGVIEQCLKIADSFLIGSAKSEILLTNGVAYSNFESPLFNLIQGRANLFRRNISGRAANTDFITRIEVRRFSPSGRIVFPFNRQFFGLSGPPAFP